MFVSCSLSLSVSFSFSYYKHRHMHEEMLFKQVLFSSDTQHKRLVLILRLSSFLSFSLSCSVTLTHYLSMFVFKTFLNGIFPHSVSKSVYVSFSVNQFHTNIHTRNSTQSHMSTHPPTHPHTHPHTHTHSLFSLQLQVQSVDVQIVIFPFSSRSSISDFRRRG